MAYLPRSIMSSLLIFSWLEWMKCPLSVLLSFYLVQSIASIFLFRVCLGDMNSINFFASWKVFFTFRLFTIVLLDSSLGWYSWSFRSWSTISKMQGQVLQTFLTYKLSFEKSVAALIDFSFSITCVSSFSAFITLSLFFIISVLTISCRG